MDAPGRWRWLFVLVTLFTACTRAHYRRSADDESYAILAEHEVDPRYDAGRVDLDPPPQSRLFDPFDPDRPPKPPDDPAAAIFMENPGGMRGAHGWEKDGVASLIEPTGWEAALDFDESGVVQLTQERAVEIALLDSREYQTQLENLYLSALRLSLNRFDFDLQWFGRNRTSYTHFGSGGAANGETNTLTSLTDFGFSHNLAAGGQVLATFANSLVFEFTGAGSKQVRSNILISAVQPLLRGFGRKVRMESLTQAERDVLYSLRDFVRFRKQFWSDVAIQNGGYLDLLLAVQTIRNNQANLRQQEQTYRLYNELFAGGRASAVERDQFFQSLQSSRLAVIQSETSLQNSLDSFKLRLGLPPRLPVELDDSFLDLFQLVEPELEELRARVEQFQQDRLGELNRPITVEEVRGHFASLDAFARDLPPFLDKATLDIGRFRESLRQPLREGASAEERDQAERVFQAVTRQLADATAELARLRVELLEHEAAVDEERLAAGWESLNADINSLLTLTDSVISIQTQAKIYLIELPEIGWQEEQAMAFAKDNRLDLQNSLGEVTDAWRKVTVAANALQADLDLVASADIGTDPDHLNPFNFASEASRYTVGVEIDTPLNRLAERNAYRASLIEFQRARRGYVNLSDLIELQVRRDLRQLRQLQLSFEISRQQLLAAARQLEGARITLLGPRDRRSANDTTTLNLLQALSSLLSARNALAANYINYEQQRVQLLLDLEALQLDQQGFPANDPNQFSDAVDVGAESRASGALEDIPPGLPGAIELPAPVDPRGDAGGEPGAGEPAAGAAVPGPG